MDPWIINPNDLNEEFRVCTYPGIIPNTFMISNKGRIYNMCTGNFLKPRINNGYWVINLKRTDGGWNHTPVHRLVAWEFVPDRCDYNLQVNHIDGNNLNNDYENLEWLTPLENTRHAIKHGLRLKNGGHGKLTEEMVHHVCRLLTDPNNSYRFIVNEISNTYNVDVCVGTIESIALGKIWRDISSQYVIPFRNKTGENQTNSILTTDDVHFICQLYKLGLGVTKITSLLDKKVSPRTVSSIIQGDNWKHITSQYDLTPHYNNKSNLLNTLTENCAHFIHEQIYNKQA